MQDGARSAAKVGSSCNFAAQAVFSRHTLLPKENIMPIAAHQVLLGLIILPAVAGAAGATDKTFDQRFSAPAGSELTLVASVGSVVVVGHESRDVTIHADISGADSDSVRIDAQQHGSSIEVNARSPSGGWLRLSAPEIRFTIQIPRDCAVDLRTGGGGIEVRDLKAAVQERSAGGSVAARDITGAVTLHTSGGDIAVEHVTGELDLHTSGGGIDVSDVDGSISSHTSGGPIRIDARSNRGITAFTSGGPITVRLPADARADIDAVTTGGGISSKLSMSRTDVRDSDRLKGQINGGGDQIALHTSGGGIEITAR
jgi:putative adhesin